MDKQADHGQLKIYRCDCCGRTFTETDEVNFTPNLFHEFTAHLAYGSPFDETALPITLCEICLFDILRQFKHQPIDEGGNMVEQFDKYRKEYYWDIENLERR